MILVLWLWVYNAWFWFSGVVVGFGGFVYVRWVLLCDVILVSLLGFGI